MVQSESGPERVTSHGALLGDAAFPDPDSLVLHYDRNWDILYLTLREPRAAVSVDLDGEAWARIIPETGEIVGFEIEEFERRFLAHNPHLAIAWRASRRRRSFGLLPKAQPQAFLSQLLAFLRSTVAEQAVPPTSSQPG